MPYVFYDTETSGTETDFDQILQFAAIKTDDDLNPQDRFNIRCRLLPHIVPSPGALRVTRITPAMLTDAALPSHYQAVRSIRGKLLQWSPATFIGYNSIAFDELLLRQALFQSLHPAYLTNTNGNRRADAMHLAQAASVYSPNSISIPVDESGKSTFRLERLAPANGFTHDQAHEAMADVEATIYMARLIRARAPDIWQSMVRTSSKVGVRDYVLAEPTFSLTERHFGRTYSWIVTRCGENPQYEGQLAVFDLYHDPDQYRLLSVEQLVDVLNSNPKVIRSIRANAQPILMPASAAPETAKGLQIPARERERRVEVIRRDYEFRARVGQALARRFRDEAPSPHVEQQIYDAFPSPKDLALMERFHDAEWAARMALVSAIEDPRLREFGYRLVYFEHPDLLPEGKRRELNEWVAGRILTEDESVPWMTITKALRQVSDLLRNSPDDDARLLRESKRFLQGLADRYN